MSRVKLELGEAAFERLHQLAEGRSELKRALAAILRDHSRALAALNRAGIEISCPGDPPRARPVPEAPEPVPETAVRAPKNRRISDNGLPQPRLI